MTRVMSINYLEAECFCRQVFEGGIEQTNSPSGSSRLAEAVVAVVVTILTVHSSFWLLFTAVKNKHGHILLVLTHTKYQIKMRQFTPHSQYLMKYENQNLNK